MIELKGTILERFPIDNLFKIGDLVNFQGPLLSLFSNNNGELFLYHWAESDDNYNRWLIFRITLNQLLQYLNKNLSHYNLVKTYTYYCDVIISIDIDKDFKYNNILQINMADVPTDYLPDKDVLHDDEECPHIDKINKYIATLESKTNEARKKLWQSKYNITPSLLEPMMIGCNRIFNRRQLMTV